MRAVTLCAVAACLAALALVASANEKDIEKMELLKTMSECCRATNKVLAAFHYGGISCGSEHVLGKIAAYFMKKVDPNTLVPQLKDGCVVQCIFNANHFLNRDKTINEQLFRQTIMTKIKGETKGVDLVNRVDKAVDFMKDKFSSTTDLNKEDLAKTVETALEKCFELLNTHKDEIEKAEKPEEGKPNCRQSPQLALTCVAGYTLLNCPASYWKDSKEECAGKRVQLRDEIMALQEETAKKNANLGKAPNEETSQ